MKKMFMVDIESTGTDIHVDSILEIALLELTLTEGFWVPGRSYQTTVYCPLQPESEFAKKFMAAKYLASNNADINRSHSDIHEEMMTFINDCLGNPSLFSPLMVTMCGANASGFDLPFLERTGILTKMTYQTVNGKDVPVGDFSYRVYEMTGAIEVMMDICGFADRKLALTTVQESYKMDMPAGREHEALYDCYKQTKLLNGIIQQLRFPGVRSK